jgi:hypothetical protein
MHKYQCSPHHILAYYVAPESLQEAIDIIRISYQGLPPYIVYTVEQCISYFMYYARVGI